MNHPRSVVMLCAMTAVLFVAGIHAGELGQELAVPHRLRDGDEYRISKRRLIEYGRELFQAKWTSAEGAGRPLTKGNGLPMSDPGDPLTFPRAFNRISGPDSNSCAGCHSEPVSGGSGDIVANVFVLANRFDFATFDSEDMTPTRGTRDERGTPTKLQTIGNSRHTIGMFGSGYIEMLARQITADLQDIRNVVAPGGGRALISKGISFGVLRRRADGTWDTSRVEGLAPDSLSSADAQHPPNLIIRPFHQAGNVISLRQFTNNAFNQHHGMQSTERFGMYTDPDGDGVINELNRADITAVTLFQATLPVPGRRIPRFGFIRNAIANGEAKFAAIGCAGCHIPSLPLDKHGWIFTEPSPYNPVGNASAADTQVLSIDLTSYELPGPHLKPVDGIVSVAAFTDFKLHDITSGPGDPNREALNMNVEATSKAFFGGNSSFLTRRLWGAGNQGPYFHHGQFTTLREAIVAHSGEALAARLAFQALDERSQGSIIEFLKSLRVLSADTQELVDEPDGDDRER